MGNLQRKISDPIERVSRISCITLDDVVRENGEIEEFGPQNYEEVLYILDKLCIEENTDIKEPQICIFENSPVLFVPPKWNNETRIISFIDAIRFQFILPPVSNLLELKTNFLNLLGNRE